MTVNVYLLPRRVRRPAPVRDIFEDVWVPVQGTPREPNAGADHRSTTPRSLAFMHDLVPYRVPAMVEDMLSAGRGQQPDTLHNYWLVAI